MIQQLQHPTISADKCVVLPKHHINGTYPRLTINHWDALKNMSHFIQEKHVKHFCLILKKMFVLILIDNACNWFPGVMDGILDRDDLKDIFIKWLNVWGKCKNSSIQAGIK